MGNRLFISFLLIGMITIFFFIFQIFLLEQKKTELRENYQKSNYPVKVLHSSSAQSSRQGDSVSVSDRASESNTEKLARQGLRIGFNWGSHQR